MTTTITKQHLEESLELVDLMRSVAEMQADAYAILDYVAVAKSDIGNALRAAERKSLTIGDLTATIVSVNVVYCLCHQAHAERCPNVLAHVDTAVKLVTAEKVVVKRRVEKAEATA